MARPVRYPDSIEPLVQFVEETAPEQIVAHTHDRLAAGTPMKDMLLASALAVVRSSDLPPGHHGGPLHPLAGLHAVRHIATRLPGEFARLPIIQNVAVANKHIHSPAMGPYILAHAEPVSERDDVEATLEAFRMAAGRGVFNACDHYALYLLQKLSPMRVLEHLLEIAIPKNQLDDHYFLFPGLHLAGAGIFRLGVRKFLGRAPGALRHASDHARLAGQVDTLIAKFGLLERDLRLEHGDDETAALTALAGHDIGRCHRFTAVPELLAHALADGLSLEGAGEALSMGGSSLFLRSQTGNPMDVHLNTGANTRRYLIRPPELSLRTKLRALLIWNTGPEVLMAQRMLAPTCSRSPSGWPRCRGTRRTICCRRSRASSPACRSASGSPKANLASWRSTDEVKHAAALAQQYANAGYEAEPLFTRLGKIACRDNFTEMHAFKHHQATYEEFHATRPSLRWRHGWPPCKRRRSHTGESRTCTSTRPTSCSSREETVMSDAKAGSPYGYPWAEWLARGRPAVRRRPRSR